MRPPLSASPALGRGGGGAGVTRGTSRLLTPGGLCRVRVLFYTHMQDGPERAGDTWHNTFAACWTGEPGDPGGTMTHCELRFSDGYATSITVRSNRVHYEQRLHSSENYSAVLEYHVTDDAERQMQREAQRLVETGTTFNQWGFVWNFTPVLRWWPVRSTMQQAFCSELVVHLLQIGGHLTRLDPATTSPMGLYRAMLEDVKARIAFRSWNSEYGNALRLMM